MVSNLIPPDINCPRRRDLVSNGQWKYLFVVLGSTVPEPDGTFRYRTAYMKVEETMNLKEATFRWSLSDPNTFTYWQLLSQCGLGPRPCIRICVYRQGSHTRGLRTWHQPAEAFRLLGLGYVAQKRQRKTSWDRFCYAEGRRVTRSMSAMPLLPMAPQQRAPAAYGTAAAPPPMFELSIQGAVSRYSMAEALGFGGFATVKLLQLVGGPAGAPQQLACKQVNWPNPQSALDREAELLHLLHPTPSVIGYYGSYCGGLVLEYCSQGSLSSYCGNLIRQMEAEEATANPAAGIARQAKQEAMFTRSMWRDHDQFVAFKRGVSPAYEDGACTGGICARWKRWYEEEATEVLQTACFLETPVRDLMRDAFGCLAHLHSGTAIPGHPGAVVTNNDLKPSNLLVAADGSVRLADWGTGHVAGGTVTLAGTLPREHTTLFAAPEKLTGKATASTLPKGEVWSLLTTHCTALVERSPFDMSSFRMFEGGKQQAAFFSQPDAQARLEQLLDTYYTPLLPPDVLAFLKWGLQVDPQQRPSAAEVLAHPYMQGG